MEQVLYKKTYSIAEAYRIFVDGIRTFHYFRRASKEAYLLQEFIKRIMLAVTEVNGCEICSYEHIKQALEMGMNEEKIHKILTGDTDIYPAEESKAIFFAQHYADTKGKPTEEAWYEIKTHYGEGTAMGILAATRVILIGNSFGLAISALKSRLKGEKINQSSLGYELSMILSLLLIVPIGSLHALIKSVLKKPFFDFKK